MLVLARRLGRVTPGQWSSQDAAALRARTEHELEPHFRAEEEVFVAALHDAGATAWAERLRTEHTQLRELLSRAVAGEAEVLPHLAEQLIAHVRWEERELFAWCEQNLESVLARAASCAPHVDREATSPPLPLADPAPYTPTEPHPSLTEAQLTALMHTFYARVRRDDLLGPVFHDAIDDWPHHLEKLAAFWSRAMLGTQRYAGNPMTAHRRHLARITPAHFQRWLALWGEITNAELPGDLAAALQAKAARMAQGLQGGLYGSAARPAPPHQDT